MAEKFTTIYKGAYIPGTSDIGTFTVSGSNIITGNGNPYEGVPTTASLSNNQTFSPSQSPSGTPPALGTLTYIGAAETTAGYIGFIAEDPSTNPPTYYLFVSSATATYTPTTSITVNTGVGWDPATSLPACFMAGTAVRTPGGDVAVETLKIGDLVTLSDGRTAPVSWIGRQTVSTQFADPLRALPVRIKADALGEGLPARDLVLSPDHALLVDGILAQAGALVNGVSIVRETQVPVVFTYYHVEVADHSLILAENVPAETFVDNVDRMAFDNWDEHQALYGDAPSIPEMNYPRAKAARQVPQATRNRLLTLGEALYGTQRAAA